MICEWTVTENAWRIEDGLYRILLPLGWDVPFVNAYLLESDGQYMLIDAGWSSRTSLRALGRALKAIGVPPRGLSRLLLTHSHPDHAGAAAAVQSHWGGSVLLHPRGRRERPSVAQMGEWARAEGMEGEPLERMLAGRHEPESALPDVIQPLETGQLQFGDFSFEVLHMPGHAPGQVVLHEQRRSWVFTADQLLTPLSPNVWYQSHGIGDPLGEYIESLEATGRIPADLVLPGHGAPFHGGPRQAAQDALAFQRDYIAQVATCVDGQPRSSWRIVERLAAVEGRRAADPAELAEVLAALVHLEADGAIRREEGGWAATGTSRGEGD